MPPRSYRNRLWLPFILSIAAAWQRLDLPEEIFDLVERQALDALSTWKFGQDSPQHPWGKEVDAAVQPMIPEAYRFPNIFL
ncbi:hypothetical protein GQ602_006325 [Ophiocordyceps camponoti-floridani]|uniref:Uncharacterized protein n=1 Tax=Ophiocordyceps camponoti-floridani TaxID=2030778 RepID=A0A8H4VBS8_9HYPO|nr:hypothetical protein GQ602_006325 [Ophiocordyceps camponoti-floridani]